MKTIRITTLALLTLCVSTAWAQSDSKPAAANQPQSAPAAPPTVSSVLNGHLTSVERQFVSAANAMPEDKYNYAPSNGEFKGVRTFGQQIKHVAAENYRIAAAILGEKSITDNGNGPDSMTAKADIMKYLQDSFALAHKAFDTVTVENQNSPIPSPFGGKGSSTRLTEGIRVVAHSFDHYGQMVEYLRNNGIIPPASLPRPAAK